MITQSMYAAFTMVAVFLFCQRAAGQTSTPMEREPHHHLVFENASFRILEPTIEPGDATLDHEHRLDYASVCVSSASTRSRVPGAAGTPCIVGSASVSEYVGRQTIHRVQNVGITPFRLLVVENRQEAGWSESPAVSAPFTNTVRESRAFRVYQVSLASSREETRHVHSRPTVVILVSGDVVVDGEDQKNVLGQAGRWSLTPAGAAHTLLPWLSGKGVVLEIEVR
jgi:hypothetical protein